MSSPQPSSAWHAALFSSSGMSPVERAFATQSDALLPGTKGLLTGTWFIGGIIGGLVIRKPGAAFSVELLAAIVSMAFGASQCGFGSGDGFHFGHSLA